MVCPPGFEDIDHALAHRVSGFGFGVAVDRIAAAEGEDWIAAPLRPDFIASEWFPLGDFVLPPPTPDCQGVCEQVRASGANGIEKPGVKFPVLGVLRMGIELCDQPAANLILCDGDASVTTINVRVYSGVMLVCPIRRTIAGFCVSADASTAECNSALL